MSGKDRARKRRFTQRERKRERMRILPDQEMIERKIRELRAGKRNKREREEDNGDDDSARERNDRGDG